MCAHFQDFKSKTQRGRERSHKYPIEEAAKKRKEENEQLYEK